MTVTLAGLMVGALVGEYLLQPEVLAATKRSEESERHTAGLIHGLIWCAAVVVFGMAGGPFPEWAAIETDMMAVLGLLVVHHAIDCTPVRSWMLRALKLTSLERSLEQIREIEIETERPAEQGWMTATLVFGIVGEKYVDLALHMLVVLGFWVSVELIP